RRLEIRQRRITVFFVSSVQDFKGGQGTFFSLVSQRYYLVYYILSKKHKNQWHNHRDHPKNDVFSKIRIKCIDGFTGLILSLCKSVNGIKRENLQEPIPNMNTDPCRQDQWQ
ncbi:hypothetical protein, partial [Bacteroides heparinolyticus]|uniref:hypothetical protein n=1 Tax=Prevotella heparinolytica TaxID=28113 RepID=UPI0035A05A3B